MPELPIEDAIPRFKQNEDRVDQFVNGPDNATWQPSSGAPAPTLRKLIKDINTEGEGWLAEAEAAADRADAAATVLENATYGTATGFTVASLSPVTLPNPDWVVTAVYVDGLFQSAPDNWEQVGNQLTLKRSYFIGKTCEYVYRQAGDAAIQDNVDLAIDAARDSEAAAGLAQAARDSTFVNGGRVATTIAAGRALAADGQQFAVVEGDWVQLYTRTSSTTETIITGARYPTASRFGRFETLDAGMAIAVQFADDRILPVQADDGSTPPPGPEAGTAGSLTERLSRGLTPYGDLLLPLFGDWVLRSTRMRLRRLRQGNGGQVVLAFCGDSWVQSDAYWLRQFAKQLQDQFGYAAAGWVGLQWFGTTSGTWVDGGTQPSGGGAGNARTDLIPAPVFSGLWTSDNGAGGFAAPSIGWAETSAPGAYVRFTVPAGHTAADLHFIGTTAGGTVEYSWDGGATWQTAINVTGTNGVPSVVPLINVPTDAATLRFRRASGTIRLSGVNLKSTANGVVVHKLGASGSNSTQWASVNLSIWADQIAALEAHMVAVLLGTNDASGAATPQTVATNAAAIMAAIRAESAALDRLWIMPPDRSGTPTAVRMDQYAAAVRERAVANRFAFLDLQYAFGADPAEYAVGGVFPLMDGSNVHPTPATGGAVIADAVHRIIAPVV